MPKKLNRKQIDANVDQQNYVLRDLVAELLSTIGTAILADEKFEGTTIRGSKLQILHQQLLYFVYRLVFLQVAHSKRLWIVEPSKWARVLNKDASWQEVLDICEVLRLGDPKRGLLPLNTWLWEKEACPLITRAKLTKQQSKEVWSALQPPEFNWANVNSKELSLAFEALLGFVPSIDYTNQVYSVRVKAGNDRKASGAFYTPIELVDKVLQSTVIPAIEQTLQGLPADKQEAALLQLTVCDPACGSGNFLVAVSRLLAERLTLIRLQYGHEKDVSYQGALRDVLKNCIYGVDLNPLTVEMCKIVLWLELGIPTQSFDMFQHIQCGNGLLGATEELIERGIQTEYFELILPNDEREVRNCISKVNRLEENGQPPVVMDGIVVPKHDQVSLLADMVCAALVWPKIKGWELAPTHGHFELLRNGRISKQLSANILKLKDQFRFFHWDQSFPKVFERGGFDVVIGNPPYLASRYLSKHHPYQRRAIPKMYDTASGNWDIYIPFTELAFRILKPNGFQAFVTPNKIVGAEYSSVLQEQILFRNRMVEVHDYSRLNLFDGANVAVVIVVNQKTASNDQDTVDFYQYQNSVHAPSEPQKSTLAELKALPKGFISFPLTASDQTIGRWMGLSTKVEDVTAVSDGLSTDQAYKVAKFVSNGTKEDWQVLEKVKLVNTGTIDPFKLKWGEQSIKFLGFEGDCPIVDPDKLRTKYPKRFAQTQIETVGVAGLATRLEAVVLPMGVLSGVATVLLRPKKDVCPFALVAMLNSKLYSDLYKGLFGMAGMTADVLNYSAKQVAQLPMPNPMFFQPCSQTVSNLSEVCNLPMCEQLSALGYWCHQNSDQVDSAVLTAFLNELVLGFCSRDLKT